jgi:glycosyltransferase involved in cell wall biosynthesis
VTRDRSHAPAVCIAIPVYDGAAYIADAVESALAQEYDNLRVVVVDNASTDGTGEVVARYRDERLIYRRFEEHVPVARNYARALDASEAACVLLLASDNVLVPGAVSALVSALERNPECGLAYGRAAVVSTDGKVRRMGGALRPPHRGVVRDLERRLIDDGFNLHIDGVLFRRDLPGLCFEPAAQRACDLDLLLRLGRSGVAAVGIEQRVVVFRQHQGALSADREATWRDTLETLARHQRVSRQPWRYRRRMGRILVWLTVHLLQRGEAVAASAYRRRYRTCVGRAYATFIAALITVPLLGYAPLAARAVMSWRARRARLR